MLLAPTTGATNWSVDRLWEYQRGYIGPSVWSHFMDRFGTQAYDLDESHYTEEGKSDYKECKSAFDSRRQSCDSQFVSFIAAGPVVLRTTKWGRDDWRSVVIVAVAPADPWATQLVQEYAYEITSRGEPRSMVALPRAVSSDQVLTSPDRAMFACTNYSYACVSLTDNDGSIGMSMPGSAPDAVGRLLWFKELVMPAQRPWLECDPAGNPVATSPALSARPAGGGYVLRKESHEMIFPLWLVEPAEGEAHIANLRVPFEGVMTAPDMNCRRDGTTTHTWGWRGLALTWLEFAGDRLRVILGNSSSTWTLEFDAKLLTSPK